MKSGAKSNSGAELSNSTPAGIRAGSGYRMRTSDERQRIPMTGRRLGGDKLEIRLGALQIVVWLGLALGAIFGSYGLGFVSGRSVGFDNARSASGVEVAKLAISDVLPESSNQNISGIYDKLNAPAILEQGSTAVKRSKGAADTRGARGEGELAAASAQEIQQETIPEVESIFSNSELVDELSATTPRNVRLLGGEEEPLEDIPSQPKARANDRSVGALLDERIANNGQEQEVNQKVLGTVANGTVTQLANEDNTSAKVAVANKVQKQAESALKIAVKKRLPEGYFAQVAAPKQLPQAEQIAKKLQKSGFPVVIESTTVKGENFYRVVVGPEDNKIQAQRLIAQLKGEKYLVSSPFIIRRTSTP